MKKIRKYFPFGSRVLKTALSVAIAVLLSRLITDNTDAVFFAAFGAMLGIERSISAALRQGLTQVVSVVCGTVLGYGAALLFPNSTPAVLVGTGILVVIVLCNRLKINYAITLSSLVFLSATLTPSDDLLGDSILRVVFTAGGILIALLINIVIRPYSNKRRIVQLLRELQGKLLKQAEQIVVLERFPALSEDLVLVRSLDQELILYHEQRFLRRKNEEALLSGCNQLVQRMMQELEAICGMDCLGDIALENRAILEQLGLKIPAERLLPRKCTRRDTIVMNYHLEKFLAGYRYLNELLDE
ncbi:MAG: FUSC family protein [Oscillospiraceae bacterium]|nr:FUSC family protein [Oscillospiraceae bacterium]